MIVVRGVFQAKYGKSDELAELFKEAVRVNAPALILSHVHPSGDPTPSPEDVRVTQQAYLASKILGIELLDHIVLGKDVWVSLKERGLGFDQLLLIPT